MKVLITGGAGFIGFHLAKSLVMKGYKVDIADLLKKEDFDKELNQLIKNNNCNYIECDLLIKLDTYFNVKKNYDYIIHLAAIVGVENVISNSYSVLCKNQLMLQNIIDFARKQNCKPKIIFTSTSEVYGGSQYHELIKYPTNEENIIVLPDLSLPRTSYMLSKLYGEAMCHSSGLDCLILRPHNIYGPRMGMKHVIPQLIKKILNTPEQGVLDVYSPNHSRTFCYVNYAVKKIISLLEKPKFIPNVLNLGVTEPEIKIKDLAKILIKLSNRNDISINELENTQGSPSRRVPDTTKLNKISQDITITSLMEGVSETYNWYREFLKQI
tara:strand:+ start:298 stop:1275 length:978 start_codon:yes stop_codon:yes gene_type:complete